MYVLIDVALSGLSQRYNCLRLVKVDSAAISEIWLPSHNDSSLVKVDSAAIFEIWLL